GYGRCGGGWSERGREGGGGGGAARVPGPEWRWQRSALLGRHGRGSRCPGSRLRSRSPRPCIAGVRSTGAGLPRGRSLVGGRPPSPCVVVHYHEISLKGGNRPLFLRRLSRNLVEVTAGCGVRGVRRLPGRLVLDLTEGADLARIRERVATVFGIAYFAPALSLPPEWGAVQAAVLQLLEGRSFESFRITARRTFKVFPMPS